MIVNSTNVSVLYEKLERCVNDDLDPHCRSYAMQLLCQCAGSYADTTVQVRGYGSAVANQTLKLKDAVFIVLGTIIGDTQAPIRAMACNFLGNIESNEQILCQLLSKEAPGSINVDGHDVALPWSYCGSFVVALEDEFEMVRLAAISAIRKLALKSKNFSTRAVEFLVDSFQDESATVRVASFLALADIVGSHSVTLSLSPVESILSHLDDTEAESRRAVRVLISSLILEDEETLIKILRCLPLALAKFPEEEHEYYVSLFALGKRNPSLVNSSCGRLLKTEKFYLIQEPKIEDATYTVRLAVIVAALHVQPQFHPAVPNFVFRHYHFLKIKYGIAVPNFYNHELYDQFYQSKITKSTQAGTLEERRQSLLSRIACMLRQPSNVTDRQRDTLIANIKYNEVGFREGFQAFLFTMVQNRGSNDVLLGFENVSVDLQDFVLGNGPLVVDESIQRLSVNIYPISYTMERPYKCSGKCPMHLVIKGKLSTTTTKTIAAQVNFSNGQSQRFPAEITKDNVIVSLLKIPAATIASLDSGPHQIALTILSIDENCAFPLGLSASLYIDLNKQ
ncbi:hypothetical protein PSACC_01910 [Paramicrosporidium saccamoebae]|uniref:Uncharacterized protein n=1 Tax=Paramicrosporidium saccamoebae TaxID=1246581 RepID=A0A2H9TKJ2_9FUNG|nr:hypothetical protein PSACC_01910 [Paramicrosporidium saccamoebae]